MSLFRDYNNNVNIIKYIFMRFKLQIDHYVVNNFNSLHRGTKKETLFCFKSL